MLISITINNMLRVLKYYYVEMADLQLCTVVCLFHVVHNHYVNQNDNNRNMQIWIESQHSARGLIKLYQVRLLAMGLVSIIDKNKETFCTQQNKKYYLKYLPLFSITQPKFTNLPHIHTFKKIYFIFPCNWSTHSNKVISINGP
jgi:hypothetical protein